jgi:hypothetical protein
MKPYHHKTLTQLYVKELSVTSSCVTLLLYMQPPLSAATQRLQFARDTNTCGRINSSSRTA